MRCSGLSSVIGRIALAGILGVLGKDALELIGKAEVIHDQAAGFVLEPSTPELARQIMRSIRRSPTERRQRGSQHAIHAGDDLHEPVALHRLVGIYGVQAGSVKTGQPYVAHDDDFEGGLGVLELSRLTEAGQTADRQPAGLIRRGAADGLNLCREGINYIEPGLNISRLRCRYDGFGGLFTGILNVLPW